MNQSWKMGTLEIKNRLVRGATDEGFATQGAGGILAAQLLHCGATVNPATLSERGALLGPSAMIDPLFGHPVEELTQDHILKIVDDYVKAAARAKNAGFDAVQIHSTHMDT